MEEEPILEEPNPEEEMEMPVCQWGTQSLRIQKRDEMSDIDREIASPSHPVWKVILLALLILGGGSIAADTDIIGIAGI
jgi:hypothetical protein